VPALHTCKSTAVEPEQTGIGPASGQHSVRCVSRHGDRCGCNRVYSVTYSRKRRPYPLGSGQAVAQRIRMPLFARIRPTTANSERRPLASCRCSLGDGRWAAVQGHVCGYWRDLGRSARAQFHRNQAVGDALGTRRRSLLADPARRQSRSECGAQPLAGGIAPVKPASRRPAGPRQPTLAGGSVSLAPVQTRRMGGNL
jgi:hypothetical protein